MGFDWYAEEQRVRINLSERACLIMEEDMYQFDVTERSSFMNTVFRNYHDSAPSSISHYLHIKHAQFSNQLADIITDRQVLDHTIQCLLEKEKTSLIERVQNQLRKKFKGNSYRINNENLSFLTSEECQEETHYNNRPGLYIKCIIEDYAELSFMERERVFFAEMYDTVEDAIKTHSLLKVCTKGNRLFHVYPYSLDTDSLSTRLYLTGFSKSISETRTSKIPASFRIPNLTKINKLHQSARLTSEEVAELKQAISNRSVQFLINNEDEIHVRLSDRGIIKYNNQLHLRPPKNNELSSKHIYVFNCTAQQAEYYFFKFGEDAEILKPLSLRSKFISMYQQALVSYTKQNAIDHS